MVGHLKTLLSFHDYYWSVHLLDVEWLLSTLFDASLFRLRAAGTGGSFFVSVDDGRLPPFDDIVPAGLEGRGVFRLAGRYTYAMLRLDFGVLAGFTDRDPGFGISAGATYVITRQPRQP